MVDQNTSKITIYKIKPLLKSIKETAALPRISTTNKKTAVEILNDFNNIKINKNEIKANENKKKINKDNIDSIVSFKLKQQKQTHNNKELNILRKQLKYVLLNIILGI